MLPAVALIYKFEEHIMLPAVALIYKFDYHQCLVRLLDTKMDRL